MWAGTLTAALDTTGSALAIGQTVGVLGRETLQGKRWDVLRAVT